MTYKEFKTKYNGKKVDYDGYYGAQCWDLGQKYFIEVLGLPASVLSGCGLVSNMLKGDKYKLMLKYFDVIEPNKMEPGDVVIWEYGHIAIYDHYANKKRYYFSQNPNAPKVMYIGTGGWHTFRLKKSKVGTTMPRNEKILQVEVLASELNVRKKPSKDGDRLGFANKGIYNVYMKQGGDGYDWYMIEENMWIASKEGEWTKLYEPKKEVVEKPVETNKNTTNFDEKDKVDEIIKEEEKTEYADLKDENNALLYLIDWLIRIVKKIFTKKK